jgi:hypothetical protein
MNSADEASEAYVKLQEDMESLFTKESILQSDIAKMKAFLKESEPSGDARMKAEELIAKMRLARKA